MNRDDTAPIEIDMAVNISVPMDFAALGKEMHDTLMSMGSPTDPCAHRIYQPMPYCADCMAHKHKIATVAADWFDAQVLQKMKDGTL